MRRLLRTTDPAEMTLDEAYEYCLKMERDRERKWRMSRQGAFESAMSSFDQHYDAMEDPSKMRALSDSGRGAYRIISEADDILSLDLHLPEDDARFVHAVLQGESWRKLGYDEKSLFYKRLKKICKKLNFLCHSPPQKGRL